MVTFLSCWWPFQCEQSIINIFYPSSSSSNCHQHKQSSSSVTSTDFWAIVADDIFESTDGNQHPKIRHNNSVTNGHVGDKVYDWKAFVYSNDTEHIVQAISLWTNQNRELVGSYWSDFSSDHSDSCDIISWFDLSACFDCCIESCSGTGSLLAARLETVI